jgi:hypothetical membrane protein
MVKKQENGKNGEGWIQRIFLAAGSAFLVLVGVFPGWFLPLMSSLLAAFERLR